MRSKEITRTTTYIKSYCYSSFIALWMELDTGIRNFFRGQIRSESIESESRSWLASPWAWPRHPRVLVPTSPRMNVRVLTCSQYGTYYVPTWHARARVLIYSAIWALHRKCIRFYGDGWIVYWTMAQTLLCSASYHYPMTAPWHH